MKKIVSALAVLTLSLGIFAQTSTATKNETNETIKSDVKTVKLTEKEIAKNIKDHYKDTAVANKLIEKKKKGEPFDSENPKKRHLGIKKQIDKYTTITTFPDGSMIEEKIDFSNATFYDEDGNVISNPFTSLTDSELKELEKAEEPEFSTMASVISGGTWTSGSGYRCVNGIDVEKNVFGTYGASYSADFCTYDGSYDHLQRVYAVRLWSDGDFDILSQGVFRSRETADYSAYGGVKFKVSTGPDSGTSTEWLYLRVGGNNYWYTSTY
ncbi:hypothetical protein ACFRCQ_27735 [Cytobacillus firmus]|uniref:hypothetical protein n=1 Tax=Cytobacillus firmus TaxID=1399 RepID=UPI00369F5AF9